MISEEFLVQLITLLTAHVVSFSSSENVMKANVNISMMLLAVWDLFFQTLTTCLFSTLSLQTSQNWLLVAKHCHSKWEKVKNGVDTGARLRANELMLTCLMESCSAPTCSVYYEGTETASVWAAGSQKLTLDMSRMLNKKAETQVLLLSRRLNEYKIISVSSLKTWSCKHEIQPFVSLQSAKPHVNFCYFYGQLFLNVKNQCFNAQFEYCTTKCKPIKYSAYIFKDKSNWLMFYYFTYNGNWICLSQIRGVLRKTKPLHRGT